MLYYARNCVAVTDLQLTLLHGDLAIDTAAFLSTHGLQLVFVEGKQLRSRQDPQTLNRPADKQTTRVLSTQRA